DWVFFVLTQRLDNPHEPLPEPREQRFAVRRQSPSPCLDQQPSHLGNDAFRLADDGSHCDQEFLRGPVDADPKTPGLFKRLHQEVSRRDGGQQEGKRLENHPDGNYDAARRNGWRRAKEWSSDVAAILTSGEIHTRVVLSSGSEAISQPLHQRADVPHAVLELSQQLQLNRRSWNRASGFCEIPTQHIFDPCQALAQKRKQRFTVGWESLPACLLDQSSQLADDPSSRLDDFSHGVHEQFAGPSHADAQALRLFIRLDQQIGRRNRGEDEQNRLDYGTHRDHDSTSGNRGSQAERRSAGFFVTVPSVEVHVALSYSDCDSAQPDQTAREILAARGVVAGHREELVVKRGSRRRQLAQLLFELQDFRLDFRAPPRVVRRRAHVARPAFAPQPVESAPLRVDLLFLVLRVSSDRREPCLEGAQAAEDRLAFVP